jgi:hypothetical protein
MKNTDFMNLSLPEGADKIDIEILNSDFTAIENLLKQHAITETMTLNGEGVIIGAIGPYIRLQNIDTVQVSIDIGKETYTLASGENVIIRETAENIGIITSGNAHITYFVSPKTYADKEFYNKKKVDELLSKVEGNVEVDAELSETSENPVQNKVITAKFKEYYNSKEVDELIDGIGTPEDVYTKTETDNLLSTKANKSNTYTKTETDNKITEKVSEIVSGAPEDFDTLKEMSDWLTEHEDSAASMNSAIQKNAEDIVTANTNITKNTTDIATANTAIQKNKTDIETANSVIQQNKTDISTANTNIQKNVDDIATVKNDVAINITTLGTQCKNLLKTSSKANITKNGLTFKVQADGSVKVTGTATSNATIDVYVAGDWQSETVLYPLDSYRIHLQHDTNTTMTITVLTYDGKTQSSVWVNNPVNGKAFTNFVTGIYITFRPTTGVTYDNHVYPMLTYADITDSTYEPYTPSLQEQLNSLIARIATLEGATATTEGGE